MSASDQREDYPLMDAALSAHELADQELVMARRQEIAARDVELGQIPDAQIVERYSLSIWQFTRTPGYSERDHRTWPIMLDDAELLERYGLPGATLQACLIRPIESHAYTDDWEFSLAWERRSGQSAVERGSRLSRRYAISPYSGQVTGGSPDLPWLLRVTWRALRDEALNPFVTDVDNIRRIKRQEAEWRLERALANSGA